MHNGLYFLRYLPVMKEFVSGASVRLAELEDLFVDMKARVSNIKKSQCFNNFNYIHKKSNIMHFLYYQFDRVCKLFCEDPATSQSDEFFGVFDVYITSLSEARSENDNIRRKREEEEKIAKQHQEVIEHFTACLTSFYFDVQ